MSQYSGNRGRYRGEDATRSRREGGRGRSQRGGYGPERVDDRSRNSMYGPPYDQAYADAGGMDGGRGYSQESYMGRGGSRRQEAGGQGRRGRRGGGRNTGTRQRDFDYDQPGFYGGAGRYAQPGYMGQSSLYDDNSFGSLGTYDDFGYTDQSMYDDTDFDYEPVWAYTELWIIPGPFVGVGPQDYQRSDDRIEEELSERLMQHGLIDASDIVVEVNDGEVTLSGTVDDRQTKRLAEDVAENVFGVQDIHNQLHVSQPAQDGQSEQATGGRQRRARGSRQRRKEQQGDQATSDQERSVGAPTQT
jgi:hypothetical protein